MNETKKFEGIPEDVKREMLMLFETYSKNELMNKLRSLRQSPSKSPEKLLSQSEAHVESTSSGDLQSQLNFSDRVDTTRIDALTNTSNQMNTSPQNSDDSPVHETKQLCAETKKSHSIISSIAESGTFNYDCIKKISSFNPVIILQKINLSNMNHETSLCEATNAVIENMPQESVNANERKSTSRKLTNNTESNIQMKNVAKGTNVSSGVKPLEECCPSTKKESMKVQCTNSKKENKLSELEVTPKVFLTTNDKINIKSPKKTTFNSEQGATPKVFPTASDKTSIKSPTKTTLDSEQGATPKVLPTASDKTNIKSPTKTTFSSEEGATPKVFPTTNDKTNIKSTRTTSNSLKKCSLKKKFVKGELPTNVSSDKLSTVDNERNINKRCYNNEEKCQRESKKSNLRVKKSDVILTSRLRGGEKVIGKVENCENSDKMLQNAEAYSKLSKMCSLHGLNLDDIFRRKEMIDMIEKHKNNTEAIVFIGKHKCSNTGKIEPIVHVHRSKKVLLETLAVIQNKNNTINNSSNNITNNSILD